MRKVAALMRASWLDAASYRMRMAFTIASVIGVSATFYYVAGALQPMMEKSIQQEGGRYFPFVVLGMVTVAFMRTAVTALPAELGTSISTGTMEAVLATPTRLATLLTGMLGYPFTWAAVRVLVTLLIAAAVHAEIVWSRAPLALAILLLITLTYLSFGLFSAALILAFRTSGPLEDVVIAASTILGGVYYPTQVIPSWLRGASTFVPLTYGTRALRRAVLEPRLSFAVLTTDVLYLAASAVVLLTLSLCAFSWALRYARRAGTLAQY